MKYIRLIGVLLGLTFAPLAVAGCGDSFEHIDTPAAIAFEQKLRDALEAQYRESHPTFLGRDDIKEVIETMVRGADPSITVPVLYEAVRPPIADEKLMARLSPEILRRLMHKIAMNHALIMVLGELGAEAKTYLDVASLAAKAGRWESYRKTLKTYLGVDVSE